MSAATLAARLQAIVSNVELAERHWHDSPALMIIAMARFPDLTARLDATGLLTDKLKDVVAELAALDLDVVTAVVTRDVARELLKGAA